MKIVSHKDIVRTESINKLTLANERKVLTMTFAKRLVLWDIEWAEFCMMWQLKTTNEIISYCSILKGIGIPLPLGLAGTLSLEAP